MVREVSSFEDKYIKFYYNLPPNTIALFCTAVQCLQFNFCFYSRIKSLSDSQSFYKASFRFAKYTKVLDSSPWPYAYRPLSISGRNQVEKLGSNVGVPLWKEVKITYISFLICAVTCCICVDVMGSSLWKCGWCLCLLRAKSKGCFFFLRNNLFLWILFFFLYFILYFTRVDKADMFLVSSALVCIKCAMSCPGLFPVPL